MEAINIKAYTADATQIDAIKAFMKALKIKFELSKGTEYKAEFVEKVLQGDKDFAEGKGRKVSLDELNNLWK
jgi:hypothetical protein